MSKIDNFNCEGMCQEQCCNEKYTHFLMVEIDGMVFSILLCEKHHEQLENKFLRMEIVQ